MKRIDATTDTEIKQTTEWIYVDGREILRVTGLFRNTLVVTTSIDGVRQPTDIIEY